MPEPGRAERARARTLEHSHALARSLSPREIRRAYPRRKTERMASFSYNLWRQLAGPVVRGSNVGISRERKAARQQKTNGEAEEEKSRGGRGRPGARKVSGRGTSTRGEDGGEQRGRGGRGRRGPVPEDNDPPLRPS